MPAAEIRKTCPNLASYRPFQYASSCSTKRVVRKGGSQPHTPQCTHGPSRSSGPIVHKCKRLANYHIVQRSAYSHSQSASHRSLGLCGIGRIPTKGKACKAGKEAADLKHIIGSAGSRRLLVTAHVREAAKLGPQGCSIANTRMCSKSLQPSRNAGLPHMTRHCPSTTVIGQ